MIKPIIEPASAVSPVVIMQRNGKIRTSNHNKNLKQHHYPSNTIEEITAWIKGSKWFWVQQMLFINTVIAVTERTRNYLIMATLWSQYQYLQMPMGIGSAPWVFQQIINNLPRDLKNIEVAMDGVLIHGRTKEET